MKLIRFIILFIGGVTSLTILAQYIGIYVAFVAGLGIVPSSSRCEQLGIGDCLAVAALNK